MAKEGKYLARTQAPPLSEAEALSRENIKNRNAHYVAVVSGRVVGWCFIQPNRREVFAHCGSLGMGFIKEFRGRGIGQSLLKAALLRAKAVGLERVELEVFHNNTSAIRLYEKASFEREGRKVRAARLGSEYLDLVQMALFLDDSRDDG